MSVKREFIFICTDDKGVLCPKYRKFKKRCSFSLGKRVPQICEDCIKKNGISSTRLIDSKTGAKVNVIKNEEKNGKIIPQARGEEKISRNHPCPCGSGKKYKHCCLE